MGNNKSKPAITVENVRELADRYPHGPAIGRTTKLKLYLDAAISTGGKCKDKAAGAKLHSFILWEMVEHS